MKDLLQSSEFFSEPKAQKYFRELVSAMDHSHHANVVHRDLKLENLLLNEHMDLLITDFGMGNSFQMASDDRLDTYCGTPSYAAPEIISGIPYSGVKTDIWSMGIILYMFTTGTSPFKGNSIAALYRNIQEVHYRTSPSFSKGIFRMIRIV
jgi:serine/threonine protein kinase